MNSQDLINLVRRYEVIYNTQCSEYRDLSVRNGAWAAIANLLGQSVDQCKEEWGKLRNCFTNAIKRRKRKRDRNIPPWRYERELSFLRPYLSERSTSNDNFDVTFIEETSEGMSTPEPLVFPKRDRSKTPMSRSSFEGKPILDNDIYEINTMANYHEIPYGNQGLDDTDHFFLSMSKMAKRLPKIDQLSIKMDLHKAIHEAELRELRLAEDQDHERAETDILEKPQTNKRKEIKRKLRRIANT